MDFTMTVTRREANPEYVPEKFDPYGGHDRREPNQREPFIGHRAMEVSITAGEFSAIKRALIEYWAHEDMKDAPSL